MQTATLHAVDTPKPSPVDLDGDDDAMYPLRNARSAAKVLDCSPDYVHDLWASGRLPYVQLGKSDDGPRAGLTRRVRADHLRTFIEGRTVT